MLKVILLEKVLWPGMVTHACNPNTYKQWQEELLKFRPSTE